MSHFTKLAVANITSPDAFIAACKDFGLTDVKRNTSIKAWDGKTMEVDVAVKAGNYDIGLVKNGKGYEMVSDWWGVRGAQIPALMRFKNDDQLTGALVQHATKHAIVAKYKAQGFQAQVSEDEKHNLKVELTRF